ncbi:unnamed protein product [Macrosiphum euphorbiae]|uniref:Uncharacterized protein n=1 Tax=Macrosiphum euphorbiae TaxID=13131 RepID=A0AAV0XRS7_9HEMI|nr:unnamed protein product [Macrosiphum euphorbiae]
MYDLRALIRYSGAADLRRASSIRFHGAELKAFLTSNEMSTHRCLSFAGPRLALSTTLRTSSTASVVDIDRLKPYCESLIAPVPTMCSSSLLSKILSKTLPAPSSRLIGR